ncbi:hypothetical protein WDW89_12130 [Deltaproteobacteria bacterium TL4]
MLIFQDIQEAVRKEGGLDYLQVFIKEGTIGDGYENKIFAIDQLNAEMKASGEFSQEEDYWTILFAHE